MPCSSFSYAGGQSRGTRFRNYVGKVDIGVDTMWTPRQLPDLVNILERAERENRQVHVKGAGWSFEDPAASPDWMIDLREMNHVLTGLTAGGGREALTARWRSELASAGGRRLVHVEAGMRIFDVLTALDGMGLTLPTLGGSHGQTIAGALSTSTHGSDYLVPPLPDLVRAIHLVSVGGQEWWIEGSGEPLTENDLVLRRGLSLCSELRIVRDDQLLRAVQVGLGRFGVIHSVVLEVTASHDLVEVATRLDWARVSAALTEGIGRPSGDAACFGSLPDLLPEPVRSLGAASGTRRGFKYFDLVFSSRQPDSCWVRRRYTAPAGGPAVGGGSSTDFLCDHGVANGLLAAAGAALQAYKALLIPHGAYDPSIPIYRLPLIDAKTAELTVRALDPHLTGGAALVMAVNAVWEVADPRAPVDGIIDELTTFVVADSMSASESTGKRGRNWHIAAGATDPAGVGSCYRANSIEVIFGLQSRAYLDYINAVRGAMRSNRQSGYMSVRFSRRSAALLSMHNVSHDVACSIEITSLLGLSGNESWMRWLVDTALRLGGRPHWGQQHATNAAQVEALYGHDKLREWRRQLVRVNGMSRTFSNNFSVQRGLEPVPTTVAATHFWAMGFDPVARRWNHMSPMADHPYAMDINCDTGAAVPSNLNVRTLVAGDVDGDGIKELIILPIAAGSGGNDLWALKYFADRREWDHLSPIPGHPFRADLNCDLVGARTAPYGAKALVAADFDGDGADELIVVPDVTGTSANDLWALKYDRGTRTWKHMSPIAGHWYAADVNCDAGAVTPVSFGVKQVLAGDVDGDGQKELIVVPDIGGTAGNDLWVMKFDRSLRQWRHLSPMAGHPFLADLNCDLGLATPTRFGVKQVLTGDVDGDGQDEVIVLPDIGGTAGNDLWVMKFDRSLRQWRHLSPITGHAFMADLNCDVGAATPTGFGVKQILVGDVDGDGQKELIVVPDIGGTAGNDLWVMKFDTRLRRWNHFSPMAGHPFMADLNCDIGLATPTRFGVKQVLTGDVDGDGQDEVIVLPDLGGTAGNDFWVMKFDRSLRQWRHLSPTPDHPFLADLNCDAGVESPAPFGVSLALAANFGGDKKAEVVVSPDIRFLIFRP